MEKLKFETPDMVAGNIEKIGALFPSAITEMRGEDGQIRKGINFKVLKQLLSRDVVDGNECYEFTWVGKNAAKAEAARPITKTLRPVKEDSRDWDTTQNLYIEGDNLEVLKILQESYLGKVKMIYIDPPYNTGHDFIYRDKFQRSQQEENEQMGMYDEEENQMFENTESNGRFHSDWCSMMYSRLALARNLLTDDGVIFISIDDAEVDSLRKITNEVFGESNFVACLVYDKNRKNDAKYFSVGHEYILVYFKNVAFIRNNNTVFRISKEGIEEVQKEFNRLRKIHHDDWNKVNEGLKKLYSSWPAGDERKSLARFSKVDEKGPYRDDGNINWPGGGGPMYDVIHPITGKPCKKPVSGWRYSTPQRLQEEIEKGHVVFGVDETTVPRVRLNLFEQDKEVLRSVQFSYAQTTTNEFTKLFGGKRVFDNPKSVDDIAQLVEYITLSNGDVVLDFFSGSSTTAQAVIQINAKDNGHRKFIMVQWPEKCSEKSEAYKEGYRNICEIGKERIRRAGDKIKADNPLGTQNLDIGFRVFRVDESNMKDVYYQPEELEQQSIFNLVSNIKDDRTDLDLLYACLLDWGVEIHLPHTSTDLDGCTVHNVDNGALMACFSPNVPRSVVEYMAKQQPLRAVFRDSAFASDDAKINVTEIFKNLSPDTKVKVI